MKDEHTFGKKWPEKIVQRSFIKGHSFQNSLYQAKLGGLGGGRSRKSYVILMGGHAKCLLLMTRGEGGGSKIPKTCLRNTWMFPYMG